MSIDCGSPGVVRIAMPPLHSLAGGLEPGHRQRLGFQVDAR